MMAVDLFMLIADSLSINTYGSGILNAQSKKEQIGLTISVVFFAVRVLFFIPIFFYSLKLFIYDSRMSGKLLYGLKLAIFGLFLIFNIISAGFVTKDGCTYLHTKLPQMNSFFNQA